MVLMLEPHGEAVVEPLLMTDNPIPMACQRTADASITEVPREGVTPVSQFPQSCKSVYVDNCHRQA